MSALFVHVEVLGEHEGEPNRFSVAVSHSPELSLEEAVYILKMTLAELPDA